LYRIDVCREDQQVWINVIGNAFLHNMIRNIIGALLAVGSGEHQPEWVLQVLKARDRKVAGITAPAAGLYFSGILYPAHFGLPKQPEFNQLPPSLKRIEPKFA
jgi:tRNA pseudouridine38-40 synthase